MSNILRKTRVYLSGPINYSVDAYTWREYLKIELNKLGVICFDPLDKPFIDSHPEGPETTARYLSLLKEGKFEQVHQEIKKVRADDLRMCDICDWGIVFLPKDVRTVGTIEELAELNRQKKTILVVCPEGKELIPLWIYGMLNPKFFYSSLEECLEDIKTIDSGAMPVESRRFRLLREEYR